jgi:hypothetical protein
VYGTGPVAASFGICYVESSGSAVIVCWFCNWTTRIENLLPTALRNQVSHPSERRIHILYRLFTRYGRCFEIVVLH